MSEVEDTLRQVNDEAVKCAACNAELSFDSMRPYVPQPDDVEPGHMKIVGASAVMSGDIEGIVCDAQCLDAWEAYAAETVGDSEGSVDE